MDGKVCQVGSGTFGCVFFRLVLWSLFFSLRESAGITVRRRGCADPFWSQPSSALPLPPFRVDSMPSPSLYKLSPPLAGLSNAIEAFCKLIRL